jgi:hypothetical protein
VYERGPGQDDQAVDRQPERAAGGDGGHGDAVAVDLGARVVCGQPGGQQWYERYRADAVVARREGGESHALL